MGCFLDDLRAFDINVDQWMIAAQDEEELDGGKRAGPFHTKRDRCRESQSWTTTACSSMPERDWKDQGEKSPKQMGSCWFARH